MARGGEEYVLALSPTIPVRPVHDVEQAVRVVIVLVPDAPNVLAPAQIVELYLQRRPQDILRWSLNNRAQCVFEDCGVEATAPSARVSQILWAATFFALESMWRRRHHRRVYGSCAGPLNRSLSKTAPACKREKLCSLVPPAFRS